MKVLITHLLLLLFVLFSACIYAVEEKHMIAVRVSQSPQIDGVLDDDAWKIAEPASDFFQRAPKPG